MVVALLFQHDSCFSLFVLLLSAPLTGLCFGSMIKDNLIKVLPLPSKASMSLTKEITNPVYSTPVLLLVTVTIPCQLLHFVHMLYFTFRVANIFFIKWLDSKCLASQYSESQGCNSAEIVQKQV